MSSDGVAVCIAASPLPPPTADECARSSPLALSFSFPLPSPPFPFLSVFGSFCNGSSSGSPTQTPLRLRSQVGSADLNYCTPFDLGTVVSFRVSGSLRVDCMQNRLSRAFAFLSQRHSCVLEKKLEYESLCSTRFTSFKTIAFSSGLEGFLSIFAGLEQQQRRFLVAGLAAFPLSD